MLTFIMVITNECHAYKFFVEDCFNNNLGAVRSALCTTVGIPLDVVGVTIPVTGFTLMVTSATIGAAVTAPITIPMAIAETIQKPSDKIQNKKSQ